MELNKVNAYKELELSVKFFLDTFSKEDISYGLVPDTYLTTKSNISSIAGTGYLFSALVIGSEMNLISKNKAKEIAIKALKTIKNLKRVNGWYYHFYDINNGQNTLHSEVSNIDSCLLFLGILTCGEYFKGEVEKLAKEIFFLADFNYFLDKSTNIMNMAIDYKGNMYAKWDYLAEQLMIYILGVNTLNKDYRIPKETFYDFKKKLMSYEELYFYASWNGSLFTYQYTQAYVDFRNTIDNEGINWFNNSKLATIASYRYSKSLKDKYRSINELSWGLTASASKKGYSGNYSSIPLGDKVNTVDGTMAPTGAISSIVFLEKESLEAINHYYSLPYLVGKYGLYDAYNDDLNFVADYYISIDKGNAMVMLSNYFNETIWKYFNQIDFIKEAKEIIGIRKEN